MSDTLERTEEKAAPAEPGDHDRFKHYFFATELKKAWMDGIVIRAVCGKEDVPVRDPDRYPMCPECQAFYEAAQDA